MIYVASKPKHAPMWLKLAEDYEIISSWIYEAGDGETADFTELWSRIQNEVKECVSLVLYMHADDDKLKGAFIEAGMALAYGKPIYVVLDQIKLNGRTLKPIGSWIRHPNVRVCKSLNEAMELAS